MAIFGKEMRKGIKGFAIWTGIVAFMLLICIFMYPEMKGQMEELNEMFASMGSFTKAFGMDSLNYGTMVGFYGIECGNMLGLGGGFFAAYLGITIMSKEEKNHTAEFLLTHPVSRVSVMAQKLLSVLAQIILMNVIIYACGVIGIAAIGEDIPWKELTFVHIAYLVLQIEIGLICFGLSAFIRKGAIGMGLGMAAVLYFMNIIRNISDSGAFLKYITPYAYADPSEIISKEALKPALMALGIAYGIIVSCIGLYKYIKKDIAS